MGSGSSTKKGPDKQQSTEQVQSPRQQQQQNQHPSASSDSSRELPLEPMSEEKKIQSDSNKNDKNVAQTKAKTIANEPAGKNDKAPKTSSETRVNKMATTEFAPQKSRTQLQSAKRPRSVGRGKKLLVRQMERGLDDEEDIDGLDRMKTKMRLKREKTEMRKMTSVVEREKKHPDKFMKAAEKIISSVHDGQRSKQNELFLGNVMAECPPTAKIVRIFTSSTFTDTEKERNKLMINAYPKITTFCQELGYEFQVVDMRWGIRDEATDDHMGTDICLREIQMCQRLSTGPNFVSLLSHKYGYTDFPKSVDAEEFEEILGQIESKEVLNTFKKWFEKDTNSLPPTYIASRISSKLPDFKSEEKEKRDAAKKKWWAESELIQNTLEEVALKIFDAERARKYVRSVTETEVTKGVLDVKDVSRSCLWIKRTITDLNQQESSYLLSRYTECDYNNSVEKVQKARNMLKDLRDVRMTEKLPAGNTLNYKVKWNKKEGIAPTADHKTYLQSMCRDFVNIMCSKIKRATEERQVTEDPLVHEIVQHVKFCQDRCQWFYGRHDVLERAKNYVLGMSNIPLVLHGVSGSGKTSISAMIAKEAWNWTKQKAAVIFRFIGTTPDSSTLGGLLSSITSQIKRVYDTTRAESKDIRSIVEEFHESMMLATAERPLLVIIDSLDMLDPTHNARQLLWLPYKLKSHIKMIVSTLPDSEYEAFPVLQAAIKSSDNFIEIPKLPDNDVNGILNKWLQLKQRQLTKDQTRIVLEAFRKCSIPLFLKLAFDKASQWTSFAPRDTTVLDVSVRACIDSLFKRLEEYHGHMFVSHALGYLTAARNGLTESELNDILSCDDDVLNDVYTYWTPPVRRLPPLLLIRLRADLEEYIANRRIDNVHVTNWYHRQFTEAAQARYCDKPETKKILHGALADFFQGIWAEGKKKPFTDRKGVLGSEDRHVTAQPLMFGNTFNLRKLNNTPYHRTKAGQLDLLKKDCLCNMEFLLNKLKATSLWSLMDDYHHAVQVFPADELLANIKEVLHLSQEGLTYDPNQLIPQILGRMTTSQSTKSFIQECISHPIPYILPNKRILTQPGGQLVHKMAGHRGEIQSLDMTKDSSQAVTCSDDGTVRLWDIKNGKQLRMLDGLGKVSRALFCNSDTCLLINTNQTLSVRSLQTIEKLFDIASARDEYPSCLVGEGKSQCAVFINQSASLMDLKDGTEAFKVELGGSFAIKFPALASGSRNYAAVTTEDQIFLTVLDLQKKRFTPMFRGFDSFIDDEGESTQIEIEEITITPDEKHVIYSNIYTNDIVFLDFKVMQKVKVFKGNTSDYVRSLKCLPDGKFVYFVNGAFLTFLDGGNMKSTLELEHTVDVISACTNDLKTVVTISEDSIVRVFDRSRTEQKMSNTPGVSANRIRMVCLHPNPRYLVGFGFKDRQADSQFIFVYDLIKSCAVREKMLDCSILQFEVINEHEIILLHDVVLKLKVVSIDKLVVLREFQGYLSERIWTFKYVDSRKEVLCFTRGRNGVKVYDYITGKTVAILPAKEKQKLDGFVVNESGTTVVTWSTDETVSFQVFDLRARRLTVTFQSTNATFSSDEIRLSPDGNLLLFMAEAIPTRSKTDVEETILEVWDSKKGSKITEIVDMEYYNKYYTMRDRSQSTAMDSFILLDNKQVLVAHDDYIVRLFDMQTGNLIKRLHGHVTGVELIYNPASAVFLTYGSWEEENSLRVWDKTSLECLTSYTMDRLAGQVTFSKDGNFILGVTGKPAEIIIWNFFNFTSMPSNAKNYPELFKLQATGGDKYLDLIPEDETIQLDPSDLDQSMDVESSDDDDDFV